MDTPTPEHFLIYMGKGKIEQMLPPTKIAVLIDGGFFIKRFNAQYNKDHQMSASEIADYMYTMAHQHVGNNNVLYRIFYYDCEPLDKKFHNPITKKPIDYKKTPQYAFRQELFEALKRKRKVALRLGTLKENGDWHIRPSKVKALIKGDISIDELTENDVYLDVHQKGIDMKIAVDIASLALKQFVDTIVLFSGDCDFVPAAKLARREGVDFILDPMNANVDPQLFEHIDGMHNAFPHIKRLGRSVKKNK